MEMEYQYLKHGKPIPAGWELASDLAGTHHGHHATLIKHQPLILGDCLDILPAFESQSVDMILCDLPYGTTNCEWDFSLPLDKLWNEYRRICKGAIVLFAQAPFDKILGCSNLREFRHEWVWEKTNPTGHLNAKKAPMKAHENILVFYKKKYVYNPQKTSGHERKTSVKRKEKSPLWNKQNFSELPYDSTERYPRSVLVFPSDKQKSNLHPTQKPVALCEYLIRTYTNEGDTVLDNCMGSGTTAVASYQCGRKFIGIEKNREFFEIAKMRVGGLFI